MIKESSSVQTKYKKIKGKKKKHKALKRLIFTKTNQIHLFFRIL